MIAPLRIALILNGDAGTLKGLDPAVVGEELATIFRAQGHGVVVEVGAGKAAIAAIRRACEDGTVGAVVVAGGDGTVSAAAAAAAETGATLGVIPLGTMNFFARSLGIPTERNAAAEALAEGSVRTVDIGRANGRTFVHALSLGIHPAMVQAREKLDYHSRYGKMLASLKAFLFVLRHHRRFDVTIETDAGRITRRTAGLVVSNNPLGEGHAPYADRLNDGLLAVYITSARSLLDLLRVTASAALGSAPSHPLVEEHPTRQAEIATRGRPVPITIDGELVRLAGPISVVSVPGGLKVLGPRPAEQT